MKKLTIRKFKLMDSKIILKIFNNSVELGHTKTRKKIKFDDHYTWLKEKLTSKKTFIFIGTFNKKTIGYVRFDEIYKRKYNISIALNNSFVGKGLGTKFLKNSIVKLTKTRNVEMIRSIVKKKNIHSVNFFLKNNFLEVLKQKTKENDYQYFKLIIS